MSRRSWVGGEVIFGDEFLARFELVEAGGEDDDAQADAERVT